MQSHRRKRIRVAFPPLPPCGTVVFWVSDKGGESLGIAVGCFAGPAYLAPSSSVREWIFIVGSVLEYLDSKDVPLPAENRIGGALVYGNPVDSYGVRAARTAALRRARG